MDYRGLLGVTGGYRGLRGVTGGYKGLHGVTERYKGLQGVRRGYMGLQELQGVTGIQKTVNLNTHSVLVAQVQRKQVFCWNKDMLMHFLKWHRLCAFYRLGSSQSLAVVFEV